MIRSYYSHLISTFLSDDSDSILGKLASHHEHKLDEQQRNAWIKQIQILKQSLAPFPSGHVYFEFSIPRMGKRVDNIVIVDDLIFVIEFKIGDKEYQKYSVEQVLDYCLDLQNFHEGSHNEILIPIVVSTKAETFANKYAVEENLGDVLKANSSTLTDVIKSALSLGRDKKINADDWESSVYKPTPTIIEAAQALYKKHNVNEISRHDAGAINLTKTSECINRVIEASRKGGKKSICFLTGVPGAGKTLAGLNIANERMNAHKDEHAVFLSGNGPLVEVLREALARDSHETAKERGDDSTKKKEKDRAVKFIQNIHHFRDDNLKSSKAPVEKVVVFDEAQRAWDKEQVSSFMKRKKGVDDFNMSEPEYLISVMDRHDDWCTIICLIGGGQEINTGEAGVSEWLSALKNQYPHWDIHYSNLISSDDNYLSDSELRNWLQETGKEENALHLSVSVRSFRSEKTSALVHEIINGNSKEAATLFDEIKTDFPILLIRNLETAKTWLRKKARGSERIGLVASSGGKRLRPMGIDVKNEIGAADWFLNGMDDVRSSYYLEDVATEFDIQGLEIDWVCLAWDINFYYNHSRWNYQKFAGTTWRQMHDESDREYLQNAYRVLLTRARQGLVIYLPHGNEDDITRSPLLYDQTFEFLKSCGFPEI